MEAMSRTKCLSSMVDLLSTRSSMVLEDTSYTSICSYLLGYMDGIGLESQPTLNLGFTYWLQRVHGRKASVRWPLYIRHIMANEDEEQAKEILFAQLQMFIHSLEVQTSSEE